MVVQFYSRKDAAPAVPTAAPHLIRRLRSRLGLTQEEFAHALNVTFSTVNRWENGHAQPSRLAWAAIESLTTAHGISLPDLERGNGESATHE
jgi:DNA-binding transcriptional regulator YiaG